MSSESRGWAWVGVNGFTRINIGFHAFSKGGRGCFYWSKHLSLDKNTSKIHIFAPDWRLTDDER